jgi:methylglutaconyl-CoA hydratase
MVAEIATAARALGDEDDIEVVVLAADGPAFSAGGDLGEYRGEQLTHRDAWFTLSTGQDLVLSLESVPKLVIARVHGAAHAGGLLLSLCADLTIASVDARFRVPELLRARPDPFIPRRLIAKIGLERASDMMFTAREVDGIEAERIGLVAKCVPADELDEQLDAIIAAILQTDRASRAVWKSIVRSTITQVEPWTLVEPFTSQQTGVRAAPFVKKS